MQYTNNNMKIFLSGVQSIEIFPNFDERPFVRNISEKYFTS